MNIHLSLHECPQPATSSTYWEFIFLFQCGRGKHGMHLYSSPTMTFQLNSIQFQADSNPEISPFKWGTFWFSRDLSVYMWNSIRFDGKSIAVIPNIFPTFSVPTLLWNGFPEFKTDIYAYRVDIDVYVSMSSGFEVSSDGFIYQAFVQKQSESFSTESFSVLES